MAMAKGIALEVANHARLRPDEVDDWHRSERVPRRAGVPGVLSAQAWVGIDEPSISIAVYDLEHVGVTASPGYQAERSPWSARVARLAESSMDFEGSQTLPGEAVSPVIAGGLLVNAMSAALPGEAEFNRWYDEEHIPALSAVPGTLLARRFVSTNGCRQKYLALYHLESPEVVKTAAWAQAVETPWTSKIRPFMRDRLRIVCRPRWSIL
jgi:hypothetical protein